MDFAFICAALELDAKNRYSRRGFASFVGRLFDFNCFIFRQIGRRLYVCVNRAQRRRGFAIFQLERGRRRFTSRALCRDARTPSDSTFCRDARPVTKTFCADSFDSFDNRFCGALFCGGYFRFCASRVWQTASGFKTKPFLLTNQI